MKRLLEYLAQLPAGPISDTDKLDGCLADCWDEFAGSEAEGMTGYKLHHRMEDVCWDPPVLTFVIERHGRYVLGSTRADRQKWTVDVNSRAASVKPAGYSQLDPRQPPVNVRPIAEEIGRLILARQPDERLKWYKDGSVRVQVGKIFPPKSAMNQTLAGRRRRLRARIKEQLQNSPWQEAKQDVYTCQYN